MEITLNPEICDGCRACELACSFHHRRVFSPEGSSIKIGCDYREGQVWGAIDETCDQCRSEGRPLCIKHCPSGALRESGGK